MPEFMSALKAYTAEENAIVWLAEHFSKERSCDIAAQYHINFAASLVNSAKILKRLPNQAYPGLSLGGRRNVALNLIYRAAEYLAQVNRSSDMNPDTMARLWAKTDGCWFKNPDRFFRRSGEYDYLAKGGEARVYSRYETVIKTIGTNYYRNFQLLLDRIDIHNAVFPYSKLTVVGIGDGLFGNRKIIVEQKFIEGRPINREELVRQMRSLGFLVHEGGRSEYRFYNDMLVVDDLNERNVGKRGKQLFVIDCYAELNTVNGGGDGKWVIPQIEKYQQGLTDIDVFLKRITPVETNIETFLNRYSTTDNNLAPQILETGRYEGLIEVTFEGSETKPCLVSRKADDKRTVLILPKENVDCLLLECPHSVNVDAREKLICGQTVLLDGRPAAFSLNKGRIDSIVQYSEKPLLVVNDFGYNTPSDGKKVEKLLHQKEICAESLTAFDMGENINELSKENLKELETVGQIDGPVRIYFGRMPAEVLVAKDEDRIVCMKASDVRQILGASRGNAPKEIKTIDNETIGTLSRGFSIQKDGRFFHFDILKKQIVEWEPYRAMLRRKSEEAERKHVEQALSRSEQNDAPSVKHHR